MPGDASDAGASDTATLSRQLVVARRQRDATCHELASVWSEHDQVRDQNDKLRLALVLPHCPFHESRSSLQELMSRLDAIAPQFPPFVVMPDGSS